MYCEFYKTPGHVKDTCFKIIGYLDQYKDLKQKKTNSNFKNQAFAVSVGSEGSQDMSKIPNELTSSIAIVIQQEISRYMKRKTVEQSGIDFLGFAGKCIHAIKVSQIGSWIMDSGATSHMCYNFWIV